MSVKLRFAPSPTGKLHVGNLRTALFNVLLARQLGGQFILRLDDTDQERSTQAFANGIVADLTWLGLVPQGLEKQSDRFDRYREVIAQLIAMGRLYPAFETPDELERKRKRALAKGQPPVYDRAALQLSEADKQELIAQGKRPHYRFLLQQESVHFTDLIRGEVRIDAASLSDPVLVREDGSFLYTLCSVIDDIDMGISHIVRGEDHVTNTGVQVQIFAALGATPPVFAHHPLLTDASGEKLSKRLGSLSTDGLREQGLEPLTILSYLARLGTSAPVVPCTSIDELVQGFDMSTISAAPARFSADDLLNLNSRVLAALPWSDIAPRLPNYWTQPHWLAVRGNLTTMHDVPLWQNVLFTGITPIIDEADFAAHAAALLPAGDITAQTWGEWTKAIAAATGRKGKTLYLPLRLALTGQPHGPEMAPLLPLLGRDAVLQRLAGQAGPVHNTSAEIGGYENRLEPTRYGDWEKKGGIVSDF